MNVATFDCNCSNASSVKQRKTVGGWVALDNCRDHYHIYLCSNCIKTASVDEEYVVAVFVLKRGKPDAK